MGSGVVRIVRGVGCDRFDGSDGYIVASGIWKKREDGVVVHRWYDPSRADSLFVDITQESYHEK